MVYAGEGEFYNGICEFVAETSCASIFGSGKNINEMGGIIAYSTLDKFYGTQWDDKPIVLRRLVEHENYLNKDQSVISFKGNEYAGQISENNKEVADEEDALKMETEETEKNEDIVLKDDTIQNETIQISETPKEINEMEIDETNEAASDSLYIKNQENEITKPSENEMSPGLSRIFAAMPGMYPFEDDDVIECVKFEPQDIGVFPMDKWVLANNSFLLHGYYTYRHLIFARRRTNEGPMCMLGVPGMYRDREKFMANMFGFGNFKGIRGMKNPGYGEFGYWYMDIDMK